MTFKLKLGFIFEPLQIMNHNNIEYNISNHQNLKRRGYKITCKPMDFLCKIIPLPESWRPPITSLHDMCDAKMAWRADFPPPLFNSLGHFNLPAGRSNRALIAPCTELYSEEALICPSHIVPSFIPSGLLYKTVIFQQEICYTNIYSS